jgi:hypothetical protein
MAIEVRRMTEPEFDQLLEDRMWLRRRIRELHNVSTPPIAVLAADRRRRDRRSSGLERRLTHRRTLSN